jgi:Flp pilus assembly protein TadB
MSSNHTNHALLMIVACGGALILTLVLPLWGIPQNWSVGIALVVMIGLHFWMMGRHSNHHNNDAHKGGA